MTSDGLFLGNIHQISLKSHSNLKVAFFLHLVPEWLFSHLVERVPIVINQAESGKPGTTSKDWQFFFIYRANPASTSLPTTCDVTVLLKVNLMHQNCPASPIFGLSLASSESLPYHCVASGKSFSFLLPSEFWIHDCSSVKCLSNL